MSKCLINAICHDYHYLFFSLSPCTPPPLPLWKQPKLWFLAFCLVLLILMTAITCQSPKKETSMSFIFLPFPSHVWLVIESCRWDRSSFLTVLMFLSNLGESGCCYFLHNRHQTAKESVFPHTATLVVFLYFAGLLPGFGLPDGPWRWPSPPCLSHQLPPPPWPTICCSSHWGSQVLSICAPKCPQGKRHRRQTTYIGHD